MAGPSTEAIAPAEAAAIASSLAMAALLRHLATTGALDAGAIAAIMASARKQAATGMAPALLGDPGLRNVLQSLQAIEELASAPPPETDVLGRI